MATPESKVKAKCVNLLKQYGAYYFFPVMGGFGKAGVPDIVACHKGHFIGIECKAGTNKPTALQERELAEISKTGGTAMVIREDNIETLKDFLERRKHD